MTAHRLVARHHHSRTSPKRSFLETRCSGGFLGAGHFHLRCCSAFSRVRAAGGLFGRGDHEPANGIPVLDRAGAVCFGSHCDDDPTRPHKPYPSLPGYVILAIRRGFAVAWSWSMPWPGPLRAYRQFGNQRSFFCFRPWGSYTAQCSRSRWQPRACGADRAAGWPVGGPEMGLRLGSSSPCACRAFVFLDRGRSARETIVIEDVDFTKLALRRRPGRPGHPVAASAGWGTWPVRGLCSDCCFSVPGRCSW